MFCINNKNMCSGCLNENMQQKRLLKSESEILHSNAPNSILAPIIHFCNKPTELRHVRKLFQHLPTFANKKRDDHIYGATRYISNTFGIMLMDGDKNNFIDQPMTNVERRHAWRMATFHCKCTSSCISPQHFTVCTGCKACSCLVYNMNASQDTACPCCRTNEYWDIIGLPCLAC